MNGSNENILSPMYRTECIEFQFCGFDVEGGVELRVDRNSQGSASSPV